MSDRDQCPRAVEDGYDRPPFNRPSFKFENKPDDNTCDYCGSLFGDDLMALLEAGTVQLGPTDKDYKCQPPGTQVLTADWSGKGRSNTQYVPIESLKPGDRVVTYDTRNCQFMRAGREIKNVGSRRYTGRLICVKTAIGETLYTPDHICVARAADGFVGRHTYLMRRGNAFRIGRCNGWNESQGKPGFLYRAKTEGADAVWILTAHQDERETASMEYWLQWRYGIPGLTFHAQNTSTVMRQPELDNFWKTVGDLTPQAEKILTDHGRDIRFPLWSLDIVTYFWRNRCQLIRATNLMHGMGLVGYAAKERLPIAVSSCEYDGMVHSLEVDREETYVADGYVTHNCYVTALEGKPFKMASRNDKPSQPGEIMKDPMDQSHWTWEVRESNHTKFYFQHLSEPQRKRFVELLNEKKLKISDPGRFYTMPFFITRDPVPPEPAVGPPDFSPGGW